MPKQPTLNDPLRELLTFLSTLQFVAQPKVKERGKALPIQGFNVLQAILGLICSQPTRLHTSCWGAGTFCGLEMTNPSFLVDDDGKLWAADSGQLRYDLDGFGVRNFPDYVVKNLGFIRIDRRGQSATIWLRPETVATSALVQVVDWLSGQRIERVLVNSYADGTWHPQIMGAAPSNSYAQLAAMLASSQAPGPRGDRVLARLVPLSALSENSPLWRATKLWRDTGGNWRKLAVVSGLGAAVQHRYTLFEVHGNRNFVLQGYGSGLPKCAQSWMEGAVGSPIHDHPDQTYIGDCVSSYTRVLESGQPELQEVDAFVSWPDTEPQRRRYKRLVLPLSDDNRLVYLLSVTAEDTSIDLRATG